MKKIEEIDQLIEWFEKNAPERGKVIRVDVTPERLARILKRKAQEPPASEQPYRGRTLIAVGRPEPP